MNSYAVLGCELKQEKINSTDSDRKRIRTGGFDNGGKQGKFGPSKTSSAIVNKRHIFSKKRTFCAEMKAFAQTDCERLRNVAAQTPSLVGF